ncbi:MAG: DNA polymerase [bacterium]|nr:DNA polymerase [Candidatus Sumerlaeota bacterium]
MTSSGYTTLFLDMNSYFASVEQQLRPELRGRPVAIAPVNTDYTCCIAASYEAKAYGVKTGSGVGEAKKLCPGLRVVLARPEIYVRVHHKIVEAVETCLPVESVDSIDEMTCRLTGSQRAPEAALALARRVKRAIRERAGECLRCSVGLATNRVLAKLATNMQKPDGLVAIAREELPEKLYGLEVTDLPGIGTRMGARLRCCGAGTMRELCALSEQQMADIWQSVVGRRWWHWLRGEDVPLAPTRRQSVGHQHVLPPELRNGEAARAVLVRLLHKAAARMRDMGYCAGQLTVRVEHRHGVAWVRKAPLGGTQDTLMIVRVFAGLWPSRPARMPYAVGVTLHDLEPEERATQSMLPIDQARARLGRAMDSLNARYGFHTIYPLSMHDARDSAPMRIPFSSIPKLDLAE